MAPDTVLKSKMRCLITILEKRGLITIFERKGDLINFVTLKGGLIREFTERTRKSCGVKI